jgi:hypothetical protein
MNLKHRLLRLEKRWNEGNPYAHWTVEQLNERIACLWRELSDAGKVELIEMARQRGLTLTENKNGELVL